MHHVKCTCVPPLKAFGKVQVLLLFSSAEHGVPGERDIFLTVLCLCLSSNCLPCLSAYAMVFITSHGTTGACVVGGVLVLLLSSMSWFFFFFFYKPAANPFFCSRQGGMMFISQHSKTVSSEDTHTICSRVWRRKSKQEQPEVWPHTHSHRRRRWSQLWYRCSHPKDPEKSQLVSLNWAQMMSTIMSQLLL